MSCTKARRVNMNRLQTCPKNKTALSIQKRDRSNEHKPVFDFFPEPSPQHTACEHFDRTCVMPSKM